MTTHAEAAEYARSGFVLKYEREPSLPERQALCGVGFLETHYGSGWRGAGVGSNNIGAIQATKPPCNPDTTFQYQDSNPNPDGSSTLYTICFRKYPTPADGWADLVQIMYVKRPSVLKAATRGDLYAVSAALRATSYYAGFGKTQADRIANHHKALSNAVRAACTALNEPFPYGTQPPFQKAVTILQKVLPTAVNETIRRGSRGTLVKDIQRFLGITADGLFGPITETEVKKWQTGHGLVVDGIVGPATWTAIEAESKT